MTRLVALFLVSMLTTASAQPVVPSPPRTQPAESTPTTITVSSEARVERAPDLAEMSAGVVTQAATAAEASRANAAQMTGVIAALRRANVAERDIQTSGLSLQPQYDYQERQAPRLTSYQAVNTVTIRLRELGRAGTVIDALVAAGSNQVNGPSFRIEDEDAALDTARAAAVAKARRRAELYATALGLKVRRVVSLNESGGNQPPVPIIRARMMASDAAASTPVAPGEVSLSASVVVEFELE